MSEQIVHPGKVIAVSPEKLTVGFTSTAACAGCHAAGICSMGDKKEKTVEVPNLYGSRYRVGDEVEVVLKASMGMKAVWIAYAAPVLLLLLVVTGLMATGIRDLYSGLAGIGVVALYYFILWLFRGRLAREAVFVLK